MRIGRSALILGTLVLVACSQNETVPQIAETPAVPEAPAILRISDIEFESYSRDLAARVEVNPGDLWTEAVPVIEAYFAPKGGDVEGYSALSTGSQTETSFSTFDAEGGKVMLVERINMRDDSVTAQQFYAIGRKNADGSETLLDYGLKNKCARGDNKDQWSKTLCP